MIVHIFLILKPAVYITSMLNRLVAVHFQVYTDARATKLYQIYLYVCDYSVFIMQFFHRVGFCLFSTRTCLSLVRQILRKLF